MNEMIKDMKNISLEELEQTPENLKDFIISLESDSVFDKENWTKKDEITLKYLKQLNQIFTLDNFKFSKATKKACVFGQTASRMPKGYDTDYNNSYYTELKRKFRHYLYEDGVNGIWTSGVLGVEMAFTHSAFEMREMGFPMEVNLAIPCLDYKEKFTQTALALYNDIINHCDNTKILSETAFNSSLISLKNEFLIENSDIVYFTDASNIIKEIGRLREYAKKLNKEIKNIKIF